MSPSPAADTDADVVAWHWWEPILIFAIGLSLLCALIVFYDNVHRATTNGLWKSIPMRLWVEHRTERYTDPGNLLYYPVLGSLLRLMPAEIFGPVWRRLAYVNAGCGAGVLALTYLIALRLFRSRSTAFVACLVQGAMGFFLLLSTINEDIMPGYVWFVAALACAVVPRQFTAPVIMLTAQCVALSWLFHSSLQLPGIGAFCVGILLWSGSIRAAASPIALFVAALVPLPILSALRFGLPWSEGLWAGKGLGTGWAGFSLNKIILMWSGIAQALVGGENVPGLDVIFVRSYVVVATLSWIVLLAVGVCWLSTARRARAAAEWRLATGVLAAVFLLGEGMNLYIQPQDPQMQIQPMTWVPFAAACVYWSAPRLAPFQSAWLRGGLVAASLLLAGINVNRYTPFRHADSVAQANVRATASLAPRERTVFLLHGFEGMNSWLTAEWGAGTDSPTPGSPDIGHFNAIYVGTEATEYPNRSPEDAVTSVVSLVDQALDRGFDVVAGDIWTQPEEAWVDAFATISTPEKPIAIRNALHAQFAGTKIGEVPGWTSLYRLTRKRATAVAEGAE